MTDLSMSVAEKNKQLVLDFQRECMHQQNWQAIDKYLDKDLVVHLPAGEVPAGRDSAFSWFIECTTWFTSHGIEVKMMVADEDTVFQLIELHFEHTGEYLGIPPTGKRFSIPGLAAFKIRNGLISEHWGLYEMAGIPGLVNDSDRRVDSDGSNG